MRKVCRIASLEELTPYQASMGDLLKRYRALLLDDASRSGEAERDARLLLENTAACVPWLWVLTDGACQVWAIAALSDIQPGRHAFLHGASHPALKRHSGRGGGDIERTLLPVLQAAFQELGLLKLKAEFEADNAGAKGFCLRLGFRREALFKADIQVGGRLRDVAIYSLSAQRYRENLLPRLVRYLRKTSPFTPEMEASRIDVKNDAVINPKPQGVEPCL